MPPRIVMKYENKAYVISFPADYVGLSGEILMAEKVKVLSVSSPSLRLIAFMSG